MCVSEQAVAHFHLNFFLKFSENFTTLKVNYHFNKTFFAVQRIIPSLMALQTNYRKDHKQKRWQTQDNSSAMHWIFLFKV